MRLAGGLKAFPFVVHPSLDISWLVCVNVCAGRACMHACMHGARLGSHTLVFVYLIFWGFIACCRVENDLEGEVVEKQHLNLSVVLIATQCTYTKCLCISE